VETITNVLFNNGEFVLVLLVHGFVHGFAVIFFCF
jgi:hypothetical protein